MLSAVSLSLKMIADDPLFWLHFIIYLVFKPPLYVETLLHTDHVSFWLTSLIIDPPSFSNSPTQLKQIPVINNQGPI